MMGRIFAVLAGQPHGTTYAASATAAYHEIRAEGKGTTFAPEERRHWRGHFPALAVGISYGGGQGAPSNTNLGIHDAKMYRLVGSKNINRLATFASGEPPSPFLPTLTDDLQLPLRYGLPGFTSTTRNKMMLSMPAFLTYVATSRSAYLHAQPSISGLQHGLSNTVMHVTAHLACALSKHSGHLTPPKEDI